MGVNDTMDFMKPKTVSIRRKVRATQIIPKKNELELKSSQDVRTGSALLATTGPVNPFRRAIKRPREGGEEAMTILPEPKKGSVNESKGKLIEITFNLPMADPDTALPAELPPIAPTKPLRHIPIDWCLKTKIRFSSPKQLPWSGILKTTEEASGTTNCVRALVDQQNDTSAQARFHQSCLYWQHPSLPWVPLFPRQGQKRFEGAQLVDVRFHDALQLDFRHSFKSLYQLLRARQCAFFYLCGPEFTVLFRATGTSGLSDIHALISPTTKGFRNTLREKGIDFQMPLRNREGDTSTSELSASEVGNEIISEDPDAKDDDDFLESLGLNQQDFPTMVADKLRRNSAFDTDSGPGSCVVVMGEDSQALFNHLLNTDLSISVGSQAGIPPTLLAPVAFHGAVLRSLKVRQTWIRKQDGQRFHAVEIVGPIMPHAVDAISSLLSRTQDSFSMLATPTSGSTAFSRTINQVNHSSKTPVANSECIIGNDCIPNSHKANDLNVDREGCGPGFGAPEAFAVESLKDCGLPKSFVKRMCSTVEDHGTIIEAELRDGRFYVNTYG
ncbi:protein downstream neighbor of son-like [Tropilaelaps mercedesae]|uniref:Protein downstream neighbor of son-like n=1 Tax=Tropilaelaps mercedesae TaxID=418985 RepID=A0A1V9XXU9_9ACAR|nr:protein downstream neighbor of son-like [Tropilaelaps mercedesae]